MLTPRLAVVAVVVGAALIVVGGCNRRVFVRVDPVCGPTAVADLDVEDPKTDILIVVDNSGSMAEEQENVARNFLNETGACPIAAAELADFAHCDDDESERPPVCRFFNPTPAQIAGELKGCGFLQVLAAFNTDFRVGVITTDVGACDNRFGQEDEAWGFRPQRGCLQPDVAFGARKVISRDDVLSDDPAVRDLGARFRATLQNIGTAGSGTERGLDAVDLFFDDDAARDASCAGDKDAFVRDDARLALVFVTDEEDCSFVDVGPFACRADEQSCTVRFANFADDVCGAGVPQREPLGTTCYEHLPDLTAVSVYANRFRSLKERPDDVSVAVIAGGADEEGGAVVAAGCDVGDDGDPEVGCEPLAGRVRTECPDCCTADAGSRYLALANEMNGITGSICQDEFIDSLTQIAVFLGANDVIRFAEPTSDASLVVVERAGVAIDHLAGEACDGRDGWVLVDDGAGILLCGSARPGPGDRFKVRAPLSGLCAPPPT